MEKRKSALGGKAAKIIRGITFFWCHPRGGYPKGMDIGLDILSQEQLWARKTRVNWIWYTVRTGIHVSNRSIVDVVYRINVDILGGCLFFGNADIQYWMLVENSINRSLLQQFINLFSS